jgi:hypothetical protein
MGSNLGIRRERFGAPEDQSWLGSAHGTNECDPITLDSPEFLTLWPNGEVPSGIVLFEHSSGLYRPMASVDADEVQTITEGGSGLTSFVLHFSGDDTDALDDQATAAQVQAALEALDSIGAGNVVVTGSAGGPYTVTFAGDLADVDQPALTATPTGGTGTVTIATTTAGGTDTETAKGHLFTTVDLGGTTADTVDRTTAALYWHGEVIVSKLPTNHGLTTGARADLNQIRYVD